MKILLILSSLWSLGLVSCDEGICKDDELEMTRQNYSGNQLKIQGYYYGDVEPEGVFPFANIYYLYRNGVFSTSGATDLDNAIAGSIVVDIENNLGKTSRRSWGVFEVNGSEIEIERWGINGACGFGTVYERGDILNDSTFVIRLRELSENGKVYRTEEPNSEFYFRPLTQKPDSTNSFIQ